MEIRILGRGCMNSLLLEQRTRQVVERLGLDATVTRVVDPQELAARGVSRPPALEVDGEVVLAGRLVGHDELRRLLDGRDAGARRDDLSLDA